MTMRYTLLVLACFWGLACKLAEATPHAAGRSQRHAQYEATLQCTACERVIGYIGGQLTAGLTASTPQKWTKATHAHYRKELEREYCCGAPHGS